MSQKAFYILFNFAFTIAMGAQNFSTLWQSHYSYNRIVDVVDAGNSIFAAAENAVFRYDVTSNAIETITTVEGLSGENITTIYYSDIYETLVIGYETGLIELYFVSDGSVFSVVDIVEKQNITPERKRINHFYEHEDIVYIATDFGISLYDLDRLEFGDTYFIGAGGTQVAVKQTAVNNNQIYAACFDEAGIKISDLNNPNLIDFQQWNTLINGNYTTIVEFQDRVYASRASGIIYEITSTSINNLFNINPSPIDVEVNNDVLVYATSNEVQVYNATMNLTATFQPSTDFETDFSAAVINDNEVYMGTSDFGVLNNTLTPSEYLEINPNGPLFNSVFKLDASTGAVWATFGEYSPALNPYPLDSKGISYLIDDVWEDIPYDSLFGARDLNTITPNIFNPNQVFISSFFSGLLELNNFEPTLLYNQANSGLESLILSGNPNYVDIRVSETEYDRNGLLWVLTSRVENALKSFDPATNNWQSYSFSDLIEDPLLDELGFFDLEIDNNGTKWIGAYSNGLLAYNENIVNNPLRSISSEEQNLPFPRVTALALDNRNQLWIGTILGLRVLFNTTGFYEDPNPSLNSIIILEDGIARELLEDQLITDIEVDGSNNKWVGTGDSGAFYFSADGQNTIYHFTTNNSPLPSNTINDISVDEANGVVYIATNKGLLSFTAGGSKPTETLSEAYIYPNPVRPEYEILGFNNLNDITKGIKIVGLTENVNVKITDIEGNLVAEAQSNINLRASAANYNFAIDGGTAIWNGRNLANNIVNSGVYLVMISDLDSFETKVLKVLIIR